MIDKENDIQQGGLDMQISDAYSTDEIQFEEVAEEENPALALKRLREKLRICEAEKKEYLDGWQRMRADFANARKGEETRRGEMIQFALEGLVGDFLPILDSFSMAFANKEAWEKVDANWRKGVEYIYAQLFSILEARGLAEVGKAGEVMDPREHIAIETVPTDDTSKDHTISEVVQKGYRMHSKIIRPARVKVYGK